MKTHFLGHPHRRQKPGWKRALNTLRDLFISAPVVRFGA
jgi:hypothetical protein